MSLADDLLKRPTAEEVAYNPRTEFDGVEGGYIQTGALPEPPKSHAELLEFFGYDPAEVCVVGEPRVSRWQTYDERWLASYRFQIAPKVAGPSIDELIDDIKDRKRREATRASTSGVFVYQAGDLQLGKIDGDGVSGTVDRYFASLERAVANFKSRSATESIGAAHLVFVGDCIENGGVSQGGKLAWRQSLTVTEQVRLWRRILLETVKEFAPLVDELKVSVVGGNHDDATRTPVQTRADDNWATEGAIQVSDALAANTAAFEHVAVQVPPKDQGYMTVGVGDSVFTLLHGHQFRKGRAAEWWASQSFHMGNPAGAHFLCHGHWHELGVHQTASRTIICSPTFDGGSAWYRDKTGAESRQGGLVYVTRGPEFSGLSLI
ncbi:metallophosphoesterase family protein [Rhodococcus ruber]|uniref:metallophosphoesterase family protein n=1 Tax=Rhodococcus ruber TaxID=1830 RepID=UPI00177ADF3D|nr:metallophosphoesterase family protein [Rhodococcus ruber]MBD8056691.1 metallophosphoesterase family protein [Rhodococcus ruber]